MYLNRSLWRQVFPHIFAAICCTLLAFCFLSPASLAEGTRVGDISEDSSVMWVREKIRAEKTLFSFGEQSNLRVIAYRPDYIGPTKEEAHIGQQLLYGFFRPVGAAVKATEIGRAMIAVSARGSSIENGTTISTSSIIRFSQAQRHQSLGTEREPFGFWRLQTNQ